MSAENSGGSRPGSDRRVRAGTARLAAVQALYVLDVNGDQDPEPVIRDFIQGRIGGNAIIDVPDPDGLFDPTEEVTQLAPADGELFASLVRAAWAELPQVDETLQSCLSAGWKWERLEPVLKAILRSGIAELLTRSATPPRVAVKEYMELADAFYAGAESGLVNAVMDRVAKAVRPEDFRG
ncbi:MAG: transcription antitermination factor NusB [Rhodospirillaceae bacterium]